MIISAEIQILQYIDVQIMINKWKHYENEPLHTLRYVYESASANSSLMNNT